MIPDDIIANSNLPPELQFLVTNNFDATNMFMVTNQISKILQVHLTNYWFPADTSFCITNSFQNYATVEQIEQIKAKLDSQHGDIVMLTFCVIALMWLCAWILTPKK